MNKIRLGIIGAGGIVAKLHLPDLAKNDAFEVALISGRKESRLRLLCERFGIPRWTRDYEDVIADDEIDAVIVGTPHPQHVLWGLKAITAGKHVLMQKPLCGEMEEANPFVAAVEQTDRTVLCMPHFGNATYTLRKLVQDGAIGKVSGRGAGRATGARRSITRRSATFSARRTTTCGSSTRAGRVSGRCSIWGCMPFPPSWRSWGRCGA